MVFSGADVEQLAFLLDQQSLRFAVYTDGSAKFDGNVGIGTDAPSGKLDVQNGANRAIKFEVDGTSGDNHIKSYQGNSENVRNLRITGQEIAIDTNSSGESQGVNRIKVLTNGNVGIGTDAPSRKLEVNGTFQSGQAFMLADTSICWCFACRTNRSFWLPIRCARRWNLPLSSF